MPPIAGADSTGASPMEANRLGAGGPASGDSDPEQARMAIMDAVRDLGQQVESLGKQLPAAQQEVQQMRQILRRIIIKAGQTAPTQNASAGLLPMGG